ncbi:hypothetical protein BH11MYX1_BH11MYX1_25150 [soil metagenome]
MSFAIRTIRAVSDFTAGTVIVLVQVVLVDREARRIIRVPKPHLPE